MIAIELLFSHRLFSVWIDYAIESCKSDFDPLRISTRSYTDSLRGVQQWETIKSSDDVGGQLIHVPHQPSQHFHRFMHHLSQLIATECAHRLPKLVRQQLTRSTGNMLADVYSTVTPVGQRQAIQLLFDVRLSIQVFGVSVSRFESVSTLITI